MEAKILRLGASQRDAVTERRRQSVRDARVARPPGSGSQSRITAAPRPLLDAPYPAFRASDATSAYVPFCARQSRPQTSFWRDVLYYS
jgi:hypothetical protein